MISKKKANPQYMIIITIGLLIMLAALLLVLTPKATKKIITNFDDCVNAGYPIMESYPEQCSTPDGEVFTKTIIIPPTIVTIRGKLTCLPHKNTDDPQTMECAMGLVSTEKIYYTLKEAEPEVTKLSSIPMNKEIQIDGTFTVEEDSKYQSIGTITVQNVTSKL